MAIGEWALSGAYQSEGPLQKRSAGGDPHTLRASVSDCYTCDYISR